ncbi:hypothetical protein D0T84_20080 [Dysgonomonas sp. 521]|uniref:NAD(P)/FAD-dependent oxidoreductase n=1 Tax=Dysgonomonas sp. 521 TaxID=2302932 RepID=UPI0013D79B9B|nr:FAD-dependent monooxygenase [Dysgonomonas sp. 521]NDV97182.1 hypothetical protein [Dysgonomonas sp. 521]
MNSQHYKTVIVGAGPSGISCGYTLLKNNEECLLIDRKTFPRDKLCGGGLTPKTHILIDRIFDGIEYDYWGAKQLKIYYQQKSICTFSLPMELRTVLRKDFDNELLRRYQKKGGLFITDTITRIEEQSGTIYLNLLSGKRLSCDYLIGADGVNSIVRKYIQPGFKDRGIICLEKAVPDRQSGDVQLYFDSDLGKGFLYVFPNHHGSMIGYGGEHTSVARFHRLLDKYDLTYNDKTKGAYIPMFDKFDYPFLKHILLIGDAGGYVDSMTGEGIYPAVKSGENAALSIVYNSDFRVLNESVMKKTKKRMWMARLFFRPSVQWLFPRMCKNRLLYKIINKKVSEAMSIAY